MARAKVNLGKIQQEVCSDILNTADVIKSQIVSEVVATFANKLEHLELTEIKQTVDQNVSQQMNQLIDRVIKNIS